MKYDLIIIASSTDEELRRVTQQCINSARGDGDADINIILVETSSKIYHYNGINTTLHYKDKFNYNRALNLGLTKAKGDVYVLANNDIIFHNGWSRIGYYMEANGYLSASALSQDMRQKYFTRGDYLYEGYSIGSHVTGWCIFTTPECIKRIGGRLNETFEFWYSDNVYADQLQAAGIKHALFCNIFVDHITSMTLRTVSYQTQRKFSYGSTIRYKIFKKYINAQRQGIDTLNSQNV